MKILMELKRDWEFVRERDKMLYLINEKIKNRSYAMKGTEPPAEFTPAGAEEKGIVFYHPVGLELKDTVTLFITLNRHVELDFKVEEVREPDTAVLSPLEIRISKSVRTSTRMENPEGLVHAANFQVSKSAIEVDNTRPQVTNKVIFGEYEYDLARQFPGLKIYDFAEKERPPETFYLNKIQDSILVEDTSNPASYKSPGAGFVDYEDMLKSDGKLESTIRRYQNSGSNSVLTMPILYEGMSGAVVPIAFIHCEGRGDFRLTKDIHDKWRAIEKEIIKRIVDANTLTVKDRQRVINISEGGVALEITNENLKKYIPQRSYVTFDLIFKMQAPLRFQAKLCHIEDQEGKLKMGVDLQGTGHSDYKKSSRDRLKSLIHLLEAG